MLKGAAVVGLIAVGLGAPGPTVVPVRAQGPPPGGVVRISRAHTPPNIEDFLAGDPPDSTLTITEFRQFEPGDGVPVSDATTAYLSYDDANLYVVFVCRSDPRLVRAGLAKREDIEVDDGVALYLDTFHDRTHAYLFQTNPLGVQLDGLVTEGQDDDLSFDAVWQSDGRLTPDGYIVRMAIPFKSLRFPRTPAQDWGIALARHIRRNNEDSYWPYVTKRIAGFVPQFATLRGLTDISPGRNLQAIPYGTFAGARFLDTEAPAFRTANDRRVGLDFKAVLRDALTLDATANPDFSQVESDEPQVTINERFETFFPEKRPFFIENAGYFQTPVNLFFSRRIADPGVGLRMTGKAGPWALGAIGMDDRAPGELPTGEPGGGRRAGVGALRLQRLIGRESSLGVLASDWSLAGSWNRVASADARLRLTKTWTFAGQAIATDAADSAGGARRSGTGFYAQLTRDGRNMDYAATYLDLSPAFDAQVGFVPRIGIREFDQSLELMRRPSGAVVKVGPTLSTTFDWDRDGLLLDRELQVAFEVKLVGETKLQLKRTEGFERYQDLPFDTHETGVTLESEWLKWLAVASKLKIGSAVNHKPAAGLAPFLGDALEGELEFTFRPAARVRLDHTFLYERLSTSTARVFTDRILREKLNYQFNRALSLRAIVDYSAVDRDSTLSRVDPQRRWALDFLLTYLVNPGTALYVGYRDGYENLAILPGTPPTLFRTGDATTSTGRQVFLKLSYLLQF
jgi:Domain of unknown function (DUF5916)